MSELKKLPDEGGAEVQFGFTCRVGDVLTNGALLKEPTPGVLPRREPTSVVPPGLRPLFTGRCVMFQVVWDTPAGVVAGPAFRLLAWAESYLDYIENQDLRAARKAGLVPEDCPAGYPARVELVEEPIEQGV